MLGRIQTHDWSSTPLGPRENWSPALSAIVDLIVGSAVPMVALWGPQLIQVYNDAYRELMGDKHPRGLGQPTRDCWPETWTINEPIYQRVLAGESLQFQNALHPVCRNGKLEDAWFTISYSPLRDETKAVSGVLVTGIETTGQMLSELARSESERSREVAVVAATDAIRQSEERLRKAFSIQTIGVLFFTLDGRILDANQACERMTGYSLEELRSITHWQTLTPPEFFAVTARAAEDLATRGETAPYEKQFIRKDGSRWWGLFAPVRLSGTGRESECVEFILDITKSREAAEALRASEDRLRTLFESMSEAFVVQEAVLDESGHPVDYRFLECNPAFSWVTGLGNPRGHTWRELIPDIGAVWFEKNEEVLRTGEPTRFEAFLGALGLWLSVSALRLGGSTSRRMALLFTDVTHRKEAEAQLRASEERYRLAVENVRDYAIMTFDIGNGFTSWNSGAERILGYLEHEVLGESGAIIFTEEDRAKGEVEKELRQAANRDRAPDERWHVRKNGSRFWASGVMHAVHDETGRLRGYVKVLRDETERREWAENISRSKEELEARVVERTEDLRRTTENLHLQMSERLKLLDELVKVQEQERGRISRELHDHLGQHLTALLLGLTTAEEQLDDREALRLRLHKLREHTNVLVADVRGLAMELRPPVLDEFGLKAAVLDYVEEWSDRTGIPVEVQYLLNEEDRLSSATETTIYRILQESLTNVARHAGAGRVGVILRRMDSSAQLLIEDDGAGFDVEGQAWEGSSRHLGLVGMRERAALLGGTLSVESAPGQGTSVFCRLPISLHPEIAARTGEE